MGNSHNEIEARKVLNKVDEFDAQAVRVDKGQNPVGKKALDPAEISGDVWAKKSKAKKAKAEGKGDIEE